MDFKGLRRVREAVDGAAEKLAAASADTKTALVALAVLGVAALCTAIVALTVVLRRYQPCATG